MSNYAELALYIDGKWINSGRKTEDVLNPATGKALAALPHASKADLDEALAAANKGLKVWRTTSAYDRAKVMRKAADLVRERYDHISKVMTMEQGKPYPESRAEVMTTADIIDWYAEEGRRSYGRVVPGRMKGIRQLVLQEPVGVVAAFTPWNFPTLTPIRKIAGALGAGCSIILKASEETPGACVELVKCFADAGLPAGVLNLVFGVPAEVSEHLLASNDVKKISFTGSTPVGKHLAMLAAKGMKRATMELGGHAPVVVFGDTDPEKAADTIAAFKFRNAGQVCISPTRFYVQEPVYNKFVARFTDYAKSFKMGDGLEKGITLGPLANPRRLDAMEAIVQDATKRGGKIATGGKRHGNQGYFFEPTVLPLSLSKLSTKWSSAPTRCRSG
jgi:succinate-semialdehyde dehydrogenase/glutarate-semialdehyde dehydrogenase